MSTAITCPRCKGKFNLEDVITEDVEKSLKEQYEQKLQDTLQALQEEKESFRRQQADFEEKKKRENQLFTERLQKELSRQAEEQKEQIRRSLSQDFENKLQLLEEQNRGNEEKLKQARQQELQLLRLQQELLNKEQELELRIQQELVAQRAQLAEQIRKDEQSRSQVKESEYQLRVKEMEKQLEDQKKLVEEMRRRAEQGSMQLQGEVQELALEEILRALFPFDIVGEVGKGVRGADVIQMVRNHRGQECGKIIYESKRTQSFSAEWIQKLKTDMRSQGADIAIIVTQAMPRDMDHFGHKEGVWICSYREVRSVAAVLRDGLINVHQVLKSQENKGEKMQMLYDFLTGNEFRQQIEAIVEGFMCMKTAISKERVQMEKIWKEREKQLDKVLLNTTHLYGSVKGIAGAAIGEVKLLEGESDALPGQAG